MTSVGLKNLKDELKEHSTTLRQKIADDIQRAKEFGDLSENAAYASAMDDRDLNEARIAELEDLITNAQIVNKESIYDGTVTIGSKVVMKNELGLEMTVTIVGVGESDPAIGKVASDTPLAHAILGKREKSKVVIDLPSGKVTYEILKIK